MLFLAFQYSQVTSHFHGLPKTIECQKTVVYVVSISNMMRNSLNA